MNPLSDYLKKFTVLTPPDDAVRSATVRAIKEVMGVEIEKSHISLKHDTVHVRASPAFKQEVKMKKKLLLAEIGKELPGKGPRDIR